MRKRSLYLTTVLFLIVANGAGILAQHSAGHAAMSAARATVTEQEEARRKLRDESRRSVDQYRRIAPFAFVFTLAGAFSWIGSGIRKEPGLQSIPLVLMITAVIVQLLLV